MDLKEVIHGMRERRNSIVCMLLTKLQNRPAACLFQLSVPPHTAATIPEYTGLQRSTGKLIPEAEEIAVIGRQQLEMELFGHAASLQLPYSACVQDPHYDVLSMNTTSK